MKYPISYNSSIHEYWTLILRPKQPTEMSAIPPFTQMTSADNKSTGCLCYTLRQRHQPTGASVAPLPHYDNLSSAWECPQPFLPPAAPQWSDKTLSNPFPYTDELRSLIVPWAIPQVPQRTFPHPENIDGTVRAQASPYSIQRTSGGWLKHQWSILQPKGIWLSLQDNQWHSGVLAGTNIDRRVWWPGTV